MSGLSVSAGGKFNEFAPGPIGMPSVIGCPGRPVSSVSGVADGSADAGLLDELAPVDVDLTAASPSEI
jgi:hypothetical protein